MENYKIILTQKNIYELYKYIGEYILVIPIVGKSLICGKLMKLSTKTDNVVYYNSHQGGISIGLKSIVDDIDYDIYPSNTIYVYNDKITCEVMRDKYNEKTIDKIYSILEGENQQKIIDYDDYNIEVYNNNKHLRFSGKITNIKARDQDLKGYDLNIDNKKEVIYFEDIIVINNKNII